MSAITLRRARADAPPAAYGGRFGLAGRAVSKGWVATLETATGTFIAAGRTRAEARAKAEQLHQQVNRSTERRAA